MIELIPKRERKPIFGEVFFVIVSALLFVGVLAGLFVVEQLKANSQESFDAISILLTQDTRPQEEQLAQELAQREQTLKRLETALLERAALLPFFGLLEETTHPDVFFSSFDGNAKEGQMKLAGEASSFFVLEEQRLVWNERPEFENVGLENISFTEGGTVGFDVTFLVAKAFLEPK